MTPFQALIAAIIRAANQCKERMKPFLPKTKTETDIIECEMHVFYEFLYFFMHMTNRSAHSEGFTGKQIEKLQESAYPDVITIAIDSFMFHWPEDLKATFRNEFYNHVNSAEMEYSTSKELLSKKNKPLTGDSLLAKLSRNVAAKMDKPYNPEVLFQATTIAFEELMKSNIRELVAKTKAVLHN
jgi:hypothetical protein